MVEAVRAYAEELCPPPRIVEALPCPQCAYDLRTLSGESVRCPECGERYDPRNLPRLSAEMRAEHVRRSARTSVLLLWLAILAGIFAARSGILWIVVPAIGILVVSLSILIALHVRFHRLGLRSLPLVSYALSWLLLVPSAVTALIILLGMTRTFSGSRSGLEIGELLISLALAAGFFLLARALHHSAEVDMEKLSGSVYDKALRSIRGSLSSEPKPPDLPGLEQEVRERLHKGHRPDDP